MPEGIEVKVGELGLITDANDLGRIDGLLEATNIIYDDPGVKESRKGFERYDPYRYIQSTVSSLADVTSSNPFVVATSATRSGTTASVSVAPADAGVTNAYIYVLEENNSTTSKWCGLHRITNSGVSTFEFVVDSTAPTPATNLKFKYVSSTDAVTYGTGMVKSLFENSGYLLVQKITPSTNTFDLKYFVEDFDTSRYKYFGDTSPASILPSGLENLLWGSFMTGDLAKYALAVKRPQGNGIRFNDTFLINALKGVRGSRDAISGADHYAGPSPASYIHATKNYVDGGRSGPMKESNYDVSTVAYTYTVKNKWKNTFNADINDIILEGAASAPFIHTSTVLPEISSLTLVGTTATAVTAFAHDLTTGQYITIDSENSSTTSLWGGTYQITVTNATTFTFTNTASPPSPASKVKWSRYYSLDVMIQTQLRDYSNSAKTTYAIYRTGRTTVVTDIGATDPGVDFQLVFEGELTNGNFSSVTSWNEKKYVDSKEDIDLGLGLYSNTSGKPNYAPPACGVMASWNNRMWYGSTRRGGVIELTLTSLDNVVSGTTTFSIDGDVLVFGTDFPIVTTGTPSQNMRDTILGLVRKINDEFTEYRAQYTSGFDEAPGRFSIEAMDPDISLAIKSNLANDWSIKLNELNGYTAINRTEPNVMYYSELQQAGHVPLFNQVIVGSDEDEIMNIVPNDNALIVVKTNSVWQVSGTTSFTAVPVLQNVGTIAPRTTVVLDGKVFTLTKQGFICVFPSLAAIDQNINNEIQKAIVQNNLFDVAWAVADPVRHEIMLALPVDEDDDITNVVYRWSLKTQIWTEIDMDDNIYATAGLVRAADQNLYLAQQLNGNLGIDRPIRVMSRRKAEDRTDYREETINISYIGVTDPNTVDFVIEDPNNFRVPDVGWVFEQSGQKSLITAVSGTNPYTLTLATAGSWTVGASAAIYPAIDISLTPYPFNANQNGVLKSYSQGKLLFRDAQVTEFTTNWWSDLDRTVETVVVNPVDADTSFGTPERLPMTVSVGVPMTKQNCNSLKVQIQHSKAEQKFVLLEINANVTLSSTSVIK